VRIAKRNARTQAVCHDRDTASGRFHEEETLENPAPIAPGWKPRPWLAALLGLFAQPLGLLYVGAPAMAGAYFAATVALAVAGLFAGARAAVLLSIASLLLASAAAIHAFILARRRQPGDRPWYGLKRSLVAIVVVPALAIALFRAFAFEPFRNVSAAMLPTLLPGTNVVVAKWGYGHYTTYGITFGRTRPARAVLRGELIVFDYPVDPTVSYLKRVVGVPGDTIRYRDRRLFVNGAAVEQPPGTDVSRADVPAGAEVAVEILDGHEYRVARDPASPLYPPPEPPFDLTRCTAAAGDIECRVPPDRYFVLGDNRNNSADSRLWGFVSAANVVGVVVKRF
jgi:signal peptidase I